MLDFAIIFTIFINYSINYTLPILYYNNCRGLFSFNSPNCVVCLSIISLNSYIHLYINYMIILYLVSKSIKKIKLIINKNHINNKKIHINK